MVQLEPNSTIERLRADCKNLRECTKTLNEICQQRDAAWADIERLRAENARLRKALEKREDMS